MNAMRSIEIATATRGLVATPLGRLHVVDTGGAGVPIVLWPSIFTDHEIYYDMIKEMSAAYRFILIDGPGHGKSEGPMREFSMADCARAMAAVMDHARIDRGIVGGTSWGGLTAAELALMHPDRVQAVLLLNTPMDLDRRAPGLKAKMIAFGARWMLRGKTFRNGVADSFFTDRILKNNERYDAAFHRGLMKAKAQPLSAAIRSVLLRCTPLRPRLKAIEKPILIVSGKQDAMYPIEQQAAAAVVAPLSKFEPVNGKHISAIEAPLETAKIIQRFLKEEVMS